MCECKLFVCDVGASAVPARGCRHAAVHNLQCWSCLGSHPTMQEAFRQPARVLHVSAFLTARVTSATTDHGNDELLQNPRCQIQHLARNIDACRPAKRPESLEGAADADTDNESVESLGSEANLLIEQADHSTGPRQMENVLIKMVRFLQACLSLPQDNI